MYARSRDPANGRFEWRPLLSCVAREQSAYVWVGSHRIAVRRRGYAWHVFPVVGHKPTAASLYQRKWTESQATELVLTAARAAEQTKGP